MQGTTANHKHRSTIDRAAALRLLAALFRAGDVVELRCPDYPRRNCTTAGYFDDHEKLIDAAARLNGNCPGVYITLNEIPTALLARIDNRVEEFAKQTTSDGDVTRRRWLFIDIDPRRPAGIPANEQEHAAGQLAREEIRGWLSSQGWPLPIEADSGNGAYLLYRIDLANNEGARELIKACLLALAWRFDSEHISVDTSCFNAGRIAKLIGTLSRKGDGAGDRPHRLSRLLAVPESICLVPPDLLEALARQGPPAPPKAGSYSNGFDLEEWISRYGLPVAFSGAWEKGKRWILKTCPWNDAHTNRSAFIVQFANGAIAAGCHHNGCQGNDWHALRDLYEPGWRDRNGRGEHGAPNRSRSHLYKTGTGTIAAPPVEPEQPFEPPERWQIVCCSQLQKRPDEERWIWEGCIARGAVTQFNALFKAGKTTLLAHLLRALEEDGTFCGRPCKQAKILYVTEEGDDDWVERRDELGLKDHIHFIRNPFLTKPTKKDWLAFIVYIVAAVKRQGFDLVVFDTISNLWPVKDENNSCEVQEALMPLRALPDTTGLVLVHHIGKSDGAEGTAGRGSTAFGAFVDIILEFRRFNPAEREDTRRTLTGLGRPRQVPQELVVRLDAAGYVAEGKKAEVQTKDLIPLLAEMIPKGPPQNGKSKSELQDALKEQKGSGVRSQMLTDALARGVKEGRWKEHGKRPVLYYQPAANPPHNEATERDAERAGGDTNENDIETVLTLFKDTIAD